MEKGRLLQNKNVNKAIQVSKITLIINLSLSLLKFAAGYIGKSSAMLSDAVHSASDVLSTIVVMVGIKISEKQPDREHPYGHERMECVASIILSVALAITGAGIGYSGIKKIFSGQYNTLSVSSGIALMADAWHHRSDALSSVGSLIGILGARLGYAILDPIASVVICGCILKAALDIFKESINKMVDHSCDNATETKIREVVLQQQGVDGIDELKTRMFGAKMYVDIEILADGNLALYDAHRIAEGVHQTIENNFPQCKHCMVHVNTNELLYST
ncbi:cation diffusion facilitator family transporter [Clostridioides difficile]|nr:cation transporter [Clostridioides difficile]MBH7487598.1 cation transporter [Clostridioides difficile]MBY1672447.1 cation diffusion facilitator family transporter [Clostridioides difficile]MBY1793150.1 cation diffusion facilitator family transporter [Clostridioides difficile]MBY1996193.1 cation diffusion facilitator family transporter [Clostridioides difficile]